MTILRTKGKLKMKLWNPLGNEERKNQRHSLWKKRRCKNRHNVVQIGDQMRTRKLFGCWPWMLWRNHRSCQQVRDDSKITEGFLEVFAETSRTKAATKSRVGKWREELAKSFGGVTQAEVESSGFTSYKLLAPLWMVNNTGDFYLCGHSKTHFSDIKVL